MPAKFVNLFQFSESNCFLKFEPVFPLFLGDDGDAVRQCFNAGNLFLLGFTFRRQPLKFGLQMRQPGGFRRRRARLLHLFGQRGQDFRQAFYFAAPRIQP